MGKQGKEHDMAHVMRHKMEHKMEGVDHVMQIGRGNKLGHGHGMQYVKGHTL